MNNIKFELINQEGCLMTKQINNTNNTNNTIKNITNFIINEVQNNSTNLSDNLNYTIEYAEIQEKFGLEIQEFINNLILEELNKSKKIADAFEDTDGFDVTIYKDYAKNN